jgi:hypothetical protein
VRKFVHQYEHSWEYKSKSKAFISVKGHEIIKHIHANTAYAEHKTMQIISYVFGILVTLSYKGDLILNFIYFVFQKLGIYSSIRVELLALFDGLMIQSSNFL